jgi:hypothetical protein
VASIISLCIAADEFLILKPEAMPPEVNATSRRFPLLGPFGIGRAYASGTVAPDKAAECQSIASVRSSAYRHIVL